MAEFVAPKDYRLGIAATVVAAAFVDFIGIQTVASVDDGGPDFILIGVVASFFGFVAAQFSLLGLWFVFGPQSLWVRAAGSMPSAAFILAVIELATWSEYREGSGLVEDMARTAAMVPTAAFVATALLWPFRIFRGWRLAPHGDSATTPHQSSQQFQIRDLFIVTGLVAFALGALRFALSAGVAGQDAFARITRNWDEVLVVSAILAALGLLSVLPTLWAAFQFEEWKAGLGILAGYAILLTFIETMFPMAVLGPGPNFERVVGAVVVQFTWASVIFCVLRVLRGWGCTLIRPRRKPPVPATRSPDWKTEWPPSGDTNNGNRKTLTA